MGCVHGEPRVEATNDNTSEVWLVLSDASARERRVSAENANATNPRWLDDGRLVSRATASRWRSIRRDRTRRRQPSTPPAPTGRGGGRGGRGGASGVPLRSPAGNASPSCAIPRPPREKVYESDFARRHEERFKGIQFDWMEFQRDGAQFPLPNAADPYLFPPQEIFLAAVKAATGSSRTWACALRELESRRDDARLHGRFRLSQ